MIRIAELKRLWELRFLHSFFSLSNDQKKAPQVILDIISGTSGYNSSPQLSTIATPESLVTASIVAHHFCQVNPASDWSVLASDGLILASDGLILASDGLILSSDWLILASDGLILPSDGLILASEWSILTSDWSR